MKFYLNKLKNNIFNWLADRVPNIRREVIIMTFAVLLIMGLFSQAVFAVWNGSPYSQGETLNPECLPTDVDCDVAISAGHDAVTIGTANGLSLVGQAVSLGLASTNTIGALSDTDWNTFNNKVSSQWTTTGSDVYYTAGDVVLNVTTPNIWWNTAKTYGLQFNNSSKQQFINNGTAVAEVTLVGTDSGQVSAKQYSVGGTADNFPAFVFVGDTDTGLSLFGADQLSFVTGAATRILADASGNIGFGGTITNSSFAGAHMVLSGGKLGIGIATPTTPLHVQGNLTDVGTNISFRNQPTVSATSFALYGTYNNPIFSGSGTLSYLYADLNLANNTGTGTITNAHGQLAYVNNLSTGTITNAYGIRVGSAGNSGGGSIGSNYGLYVNDQTTGSTNYAIYTSGSAQSYFGGNVGIGREDPAGKLDIKSPNIGGVSFQITEVGSTEKVAQIYEDTSSVGTLRLFNGSNTAGVHLTGGSGNSYILNGKFGIGTSTPGAKLSFGAVSGEDKIYLYESAFSRYGMGVYSNEFRNFVPANGAAVMTFGELNGTDGTTFTEFMRIDNAGKVGIGTTGPINKLDVYDATNGTMSVRSGTRKIVLSSYAADWNYNTSYGADYVVGTQDSNNFWLYSNNFPRGYFDTTGNIALGGSLNAGTGATGANVYIQSTGNVGIGTTGPTSRIHGVTTLSATTGDEVAYSLDYTTNKATSGNDTGLLINMTDTLSPGTSYPLDIQVGGVRKFFVRNDGQFGLSGGTLLIGTVSGGTDNPLVIGQTSTTDGRISTSLTSSHTQTIGGSQNVAVRINPSYNQPSATGVLNTDLLINRTETSLGTTPGAQYLLDAQVGGLSKFNITNTGQGYFAGALTLGSTASGGTALTIPNADNGSYNFLIKRGTATGASWDLTTGGASFGSISIHGGNNVVTVNQGNLNFSTASSSLGDTSLARISAGVVGVGTGGVGSTAGTLSAAGLIIGGNTMTFPVAAATLARTDAGQTFTGNQVVTGDFSATGNVTVGSDGSAKNLVFTRGGGSISSSTAGHLTLLPSSSSGIVYEFQSTTLSMGKDTSPAGTLFILEGASATGSNRSPVGLKMLGGSAHASAESGTGSILGSNISLVAGNGSSGASGLASGGDIYMDGGLGYGTGTVGDVLLSTVNGGNVGIGTTAPVTDLHIIAADGTNGLRVGNLSNTFGIALTPGATQGAKLNFFQNSSVNAIQVAGTDVLEFESSTLMDTAAAFSFRGGSSGSIHGQDNGGGVTIADLYLRGGNIAGLNLRGGNVHLDGGAPNGTGAVGNIILGATRGNVKIGGTALRGTTEGTKTLDIFDGTAPAGILANGISLYSEAGELKVMDAAGNATLLSPHENEYNYWVFDSSNSETGKDLVIDMELIIKDLNDSFELGYVHETQDGEEVERGAGSLLGKILEKVSVWLADAGNGVTSIFANTFRATEQLCINDTCVTEAQLQQLLQNANTGSSGAPAPESATEEPVVVEPTVPEPEEITADGGTPPEEVVPAEEPVADTAPAPAEEIIEEPASDPAPEPVADVPEPATAEGEVSPETVIAPPEPAA